MSRRAFLWWGTVLTAMAMLLAGCGSDPAVKASKAPDDGHEDPYGILVSDIHRDMNSAMSAAFASRELDARLIRSAQTTASDSLQKMDAATPPTKFRAAHDEYIAGLTAFREILADVQGQVDEPDVARRHLGDKRFTTGVAHLERAAQLYDAAGLDLDTGAETG